MLRLGWWWSSLKKKIKLMAEHAITHLSDRPWPLELKQRSLRAWKKRRGKRGKRGRRGGRESERKREMERQR